MNNEYLISNLAKEMFDKNSEKVLRDRQFGKIICEETLYTKQMYLKVFLENFGNYDLRELKVREIETFLLNDNKHSSSWKNNFLDVIGNIYDETIWKCPVPIQKPKFQRFCRNSKKSDIFTEEELQKLFNPKIWENYKYFLLFKTMECCGLRSGEARGLKKNQFMFEKKCLLINGFCKRHGEKTTYNKKGSSENQKFRIVPIPSSLEKLLNPYVQNCDNESFIFSNDGIKPFSKDNIGRVLKKMLKKSGINQEGRKLVPHSFRYTYVTKMRRLFSVEDVQKIAGHSSIEMTEYYTKQSVKDLVEQLKNINPIVNEIF